MFEVDSAEYSTKTAYNLLKHIKKDHFQQIIEKI